MLKRRIIAAVLVMVLLTSLCSVTAFADGGGKDFGDGFELLFDGEGWKAYVVESRDQVLTFDDMHVTLVDGRGDAVDPEAYDLRVEVQTDWDDENQRPITAPFEGILKIDGNEDEEPGVGFAGFFLRAYAKDGSGYTGCTGAQSFMIWHRYSFNWYGANASFGEQYSRQSTWFWHDYYVIPASEAAAPEVYGMALEEPIDPAYYTLTYFNRVTGVPVSEGAEYESMVYPMGEDDALALEGLPTEPGPYFVRIDGKAPYYGSSYLDFDIVEDEQPSVTAHAGPQSAGDGETLYLPVGGELYVSFELEGNDDGSLIPGWRNDLFKATGFEIDDDPAFLDDDYTAYAHIMAGDKAVGESAVLYYNWYRTSDIFGENAPGWVEAVPVYSASVVIEVAEQPRTFAFLKDDDARYFDGDTIEVLADSDFWLCNDLTYYTDWWLPDRDLSDLEAKGFTYVERIQFVEAGFVYDHYSTAGLAPGTEAEVSFAWYAFDDYISGNIEGKEGLYPATVKIRVVDAQPSYLLGDADRSGDVNILDATVIQRYLAAFSTEIDLTAADANRSGAVDILDATVIRRWLAGMEDGYPIGE